ncbi:MAG: hypothetical protein DVB25_01750 [Verrucomicrobia bacterium]|nr:MAG: hypothetical protein DVB25_01750 [Verrucomicrobiota bacterium]
MYQLYSLLGIELSPVSCREKLVSTAGGMIAIMLLILLNERVLHLSGAITLLGSMGASAVLLFAVPHGQLSQPWPVLGGHVFGALIGVSCARWIAAPEMAAALAVGLSIGMMHQLKCLHPPGAATALSAVLGNGAIHEMGYSFVIIPVLVNCLMMLGIAVAFNMCFGWRRYPACLTVRKIPAVPETPSHEDIVMALRSIDTFVDVSENDLILLNRLLASGRVAGAADGRSANSAP